MVVSEYAPSGRDYLDFCKRNESVEIALAKDRVIGASTSDESFGDMICNTENDGPGHAHGQNLSTACMQKGTRLRPECSFDEG